MKLDLKQIIADKFYDCKAVSVCANLPYYITSPIIAHLLGEIEVSDFDEDKVLGCYSQSKAIATQAVLDAVKDKKCMIIVAFKLLIIPTVGLAAMYLCGVRGDMLIAMTIASSAPIATITTMFSENLGCRC